MGKSKQVYRKRIVVMFELDELEFLLNKKGDKTWREFILDLANYKKGAREDGPRGLREVTNYGLSK